MRYPTIKTSNTKSWDIDLFLCIVLVLLAPYAIFDSIARSYVNYFNTIQFQIDWVIILLCLLRFCLLLTSKTKNKRILKLYFIFFPLLVVTVYTLLISFYQTDFLIENGLRQVITGVPVKNIIVKRGIKYLAYTTLAIYIGLVLNNFVKIHKTLLYLTCSLCVTEILGILQSIIFLVADYNILHVAESISEQSFTGTSTSVTFLGMNFVRINSISHEPKGFAILIFHLLIIKIFWSSYRFQAGLSSKTSNILDVYLCHTSWLSVLVIFLSFSGSGLFSLIFLMLIFTIANWKDFLTLSFLKRKSIYLVISASTLLALFLEGDIFYSYIYDFWDASILRRMSAFFNQFTLESLYVSSLDPEDGAVINNLINYPNSVFWGIGFGGYSNLSIDFVSNRYDLGLENTSPFSRNILVEILFSSGIVGLIGCFMFVKRVLLRFCLKMSIYRLLGLMIISSFLVRSSEILFFVNIGILAALTVNLRLIQSNYSATHNQSKYRV